MPIAPLLALFLAVPPPAGVVTVVGDTAPANAYRLQRDGKSVAPLREKQAVRDGDVILPTKGHQVRISYRKTACGEKVLSERTIVGCDSATGNMWTDLAASVHRAVQQRRPQGVTSFSARGLPAAPECFPEEFAFPVWPPPGTTLLAGRPGSFRWVGPAEKACKEAELVVVNADTQAPVARTEMQVGSLVTVGGLPSGRSLQWRVEIAGAVASPVVPLGVLSKAFSARLLEETLEKAKESGEGCAPIIQAALLQAVGNEGNGLDLHAMAMSRARQPSLESCDDFQAWADLIVRRASVHSRRVLRERR